VSYETKAVYVQPDYYDQRYISFTGNWSYLIQQVT